MKEDQTLMIHQCRTLFKQGVLKVLQLMSIEFSSDGMIVVNELEVGCVLHIPPDTEENLLAMRVGLNI